MHAFLTAKVASVDPAFMSRGNAGGDFFFVKKKVLLFIKKKLFFYFRTRSNVIDKRNSLFSQRGRCVIQIGLKVGKLQQTHILN